VAQPLRTPDRRVAERAEDGPREANRKEPAMRPPHAELRRRGFRGHRTGRSIVLLACIGVALALGAVARSAAGPGPSFAAAKLYATGAAPDVLTLGDLNGDGKSDLVTGNLSSAVSVLLNRGNGSFETRRNYKTDDDPASLAIGDLNGDGKGD